MTDRCTFFLARHGRVAEAWRGKVYGDLDVPLSPAGEEQSQRVGDLFRGRALDAILTSGLARATHTARAIAEAVGAQESELVVEPRLREIHRGAWAGLGREDIEARWPGSWETWSEAEGLITPPEGETHGAVRQRVLAALDDHARRHAGGRVAAIAHKWVVRAILAEALGMPDSRVTRIALPTSGVAVVAWPVNRERGPRDGSHGVMGELRRPHVLGLGLAALPPD